ncbi:UNVERIFIED_CONTAM: hypothetical protein HDU68_003664 [Siphonaria sp. JEL0065]|nr:hypothetical protein HDU68_003664 [Siphonaria sp. JEL0065]
MHEEPHPFQTILDETPLVDPIAEMQLELPFAQPLGLALDQDRDLEIDHIDHFDDEDLEEEGKEPAVKEVMEVKEEPVKPSNPVPEQHSFIHSGERPFKCESCEAAFTRKEDLKTHVFTHTGERPLKCHLCDAAFAHAKSLKMHIMGHTGERPFLCQELGCTLGFKTNQELKAHAKKHVAVVLKHECRFWPACDERFSSVRKCKTHEKKCVYYKNVGVGGGDEDDIVDGDEGDQIETRLRSRGTKRTMKWDTPAGSAPSSSFTPTLMAVKKRKIKDEHDMMPTAPNSNIATAAQSDEEQEEGDGETRHALTASKVSNIRVDVGGKRSISPVEPVNVIAPSAE